MREFSQDGGDREPEPGRAGGGGGGGGGGALHRGAADPQGGAAAAARAGGGVGGRGRLPRAPGRAAQGRHDQRGLPGALAHRRPLRGRRGGGAPRGEGDQEGARADIRRRRRPLLRPRGRGAHLRVHVPPRPGPPPPRPLPQRPRRGVHPRKGTYSIPPLIKLLAVYTEKKTTCCL